MPDFLKTAFMEMIQTLGKVHSPEDFEVAKVTISDIVRTCYTKLKTKQFPLTALALNVMISKPLAKYTKTTPQHVKAAKLLTDAGFDFSVLSEFRQRLLVHEAGQRLLDEMLAQFKAKGLLKGRGKQRTDSTHILGAVRQLNQLELVHENMRYALNDLATQAPIWLKSWVSSEWFDRYSQRTSNTLLPKAKMKRQQWAEQVGEDGLFLLAQVYRAEGEPQLAELPSVEMLRQVWVQNFYQENRQVRLRKPKDQPPSSQRISSPYDAAVRYSSKRNVSWAGYKVHLTETCDADTPNLITHVKTCPSTEPDHETVDTLHHDLAEKDCLPGEHLVDQGYMSVDLLVRSQQAHGIDLVGLVPNDHSWQAREGGYDSTQFAIDWANQCATCPQGKRSCSWTPARTASHRPVVKVKFRLADCGICPTRHRCTRTTRLIRRTLTVLAPQAHYEAQQKARQRQVTDDFQERYAVRAGVEGTMSQATVALGGRRSRYRGMEKTHFQHVALATAMNLLRVLAWINEVPRSVTNPSRFAALAA